MGGVRSFLTILDLHEEERACPMHIRIFWR